MEAMPKWKRAMDVIGSMLILIAISPVLLMIAIYIKIASPGPVLYKSVRIGYKGKPFTFLKFRTMKIEGGNSYHKPHRDYLNTLIRDGNILMRKLDGDDARIFLGGRFLRATSMDELPQFWNVLRGDMSLVGPRPPIHYEVELYQVGDHVRLGAVPGITGLWQVSGKNDLTYRQMIGLDIKYVKTISFWLDVSILLRTIPTVIWLAIGPVLGKVFNKAREAKASRETEAVMQNLRVESTNGNFVMVYDGFDQNPEPVTSQHEGKPVKTPA
jgi:lipopolysaccharide/colanic/teichoic acid biosynthesis glycosyltransferase